MENIEDKLGNTEAHLDKIEEHATNNSNSGTQVWSQHFIQLSQMPLSSMR